MLYVFHVDVGRMMTFDMTVALSSVENLKDTIERLHGISAANIVLLVSGGEMLTQSTQVSCYSAGTDTNPIYMFLTGDTKLPPSAAQSDAEPDLHDQVERCLALPSDYETVVKRAQLALRIYEMARDEERLCERLVHEQHLQQQGWSAVVANIEDLTDEFRLRFRNFCSAFDLDLEKRDKYLELLSNFGDDLTQLARVPILPGLMSLAEEDFHGFDEFLDTDEVFSRSHAQQESVLMVGAAAAAPTQTENQPAAITGAEGADGECVDDKAPNKKLKMGNEATDVCAAVTVTITTTTTTVATTTTNTSQTSTASSKRRQLNMLQWITSRENHNTLKEMCDECVQGLSTFTVEIYEKLKIDWQNIIKLAEQGDVKEIKGLSERLCRLEEFRYKIKNMVQDQKELSTAFQQNQNRAMNLRDPSILPDLCVSHKSQLVVMLQNQHKIREHRRLIAKAKDELGTNLHTRLKRIVWIENAMSEFDNMLLFYRRCLRRAERHIHIIEQIHQAPSIYVAAVTEVVRRKIFSGEFRQWASKLAEDFDTIHSEEINRRRLFNASFEGHFLNILFPGMNDMPPAFANEHPLVFDTRLPNLTRSDIDLLTSYLPDLSPHILLPDMGPVINFFVSRSGAHQKERMEELLRQQLAAAVSAAEAIEKPPQHQRIGELQREAGVGVTAFEESETDTETEFEKVLTVTQTVATSTSEHQLQSLLETMERSTATERLLTQSATTLTEETEQSARAEVQRLRAQLDAMSKLSLDCICMARTNLSTIRENTQTYREDLQSELQTLHEQWSIMRLQTETREQELQAASAECSRTLQQLRQAEDQRGQDLKSLEEQMEHGEQLHQQCASLEAQLVDLQQQLKVVEQQKHSAVAAARDELIHEHKTEIESLRHRFKLMTSMEHSPSDTSLERFERPTSAAGEQGNMLELAQHEALLAQLRATLEGEKEQAIAAAVEAERTIWQSKILPMNSESVMVNVSILKEMLEEKERQLDLMRQKDIMLTKENIQLKTRLDALTNDDGNSWLREKIEYLNRDKCRLEEELNMEKSRRQEMESSVRISTYEQSGLPRSKSSGSSHKFVVLESCAKGDIVFIVWSVRHAQFMVVQDSQSLYFVHGDSLASLNLRLPAPAESPATPEEVPIPMPYYAIGRVTEKEYCQAKKDENRYRVTKGSKFYRIKLVPLSSKQTRRERLESFSTSISRSVSQCESQSESSAAAPAGIAATPALAGTSSCGHSSLRQSQSINSALAVASAMYFVDLAAASAASTGLNLKERTTSITSVTEEDDEPMSLLIERYVSVSEEDEPTITDANTAAVNELAAVTTFTSTSTTATPTTTTTNLQQSVITEQPTASSKLQMDLMLASADITNQQCDAAAATTAATTTAPTTRSVTATATPCTTSSTTTMTTSGNNDSCDNTPPSQGEPTTTPPQAAAAAASTAAMPILPLEAGATTDACSPSVPASIGTTSEDSDEYRSLEAKDDADFPNSEK